MMIISTVFVFIASVISIGDAARILGICHAAFYSHHQLGDKIFKELASRGHEVTVITPYIEKNIFKNYRQVALTGVMKQIENTKGNQLKRAEHTIKEDIVGTSLAGLYFTEITLNHSNVQNLLKSKEDFDLVIIKHFLNDAFRGFCHKYKNPCIILSTLGGSRWMNPQMSNPQPLSYIPDLYTVYTGGLMYYHWSTYPAQNKILYKYFPGAPHLDDLYYDSSLGMINSHISTHSAAPYVPNMIEVGGLHLTQPKQLPEDLQKYLDEATEGVIIFSMGSFIKTKDLAEDKRNSILQVFSKLKQKVLWKWEDESFPNQSLNIKLVKWLPQQDILAHPNVRLLITHGGLFSTTEAIYHGKPIVGIPIFGDQKTNVFNAETSGYGIGLSYKDLTEGTLEAALQKILNNIKYIKKAKLKSTILRDQPISPVDKTIFWIEYILRHRGASYLKSPALKLAWCQYFLLDALVLIGLIKWTVCYIMRKVNM